MGKAGPNEACPCGSGRKFKKCCRDTGDLFSKALTEHQQGRLEAAAAGYALVLETNPRHAEALHGLGVVAFQSKDIARAVDLLRLAAGQKPDSAAIQESLGVALESAGSHEEAAHVWARVVALRPDGVDGVLRLGTVLVTLNRFDQAAACFLRALQLEPVHFDVWNNLGVVRQQEGRLEEAEECFRRAIEIRGDSGEAHSNLGAALRLSGRAEEALAPLRRAIALQPDNVTAHCNLGLAHKALGRHEDALAAFDQALRIDPDNVQARYHHDLLSGTTPLATPAELVTNLFDSYAGRFDEHLEGSLAYRTPMLLREILPAGTGKMTVLDLGCGTGLGGAAFQDVAGRLVGADLSPRMIEKAAARGIYHELLVRDAVDALRGAARAYDLILAADVLVYMGDLRPLFEGVRMALRPGGRFLFSVEKAEGEGWELSEAGRFRHSRGYVERMARESGFTLEEARASVLRQEKGEPVRGELYLLASRRGEPAS